MGIMDCIVLMACIVFDSQNECIGILFLEPIHSVK